MTIEVCKRIAIIGGGFSGASSAVQWVRKIPQALDITIYEPRAQPGHGLAYSTLDQSFRLNAHAGLHDIDIADPGHLLRWCSKEALAHRDPGAFAPNGQIFLRRADYGRYLAETVQAHAHWPATGSRIRHQRMRVSDVLFGDDGATLTLDDGSKEAADHVILATGNAKPRVPVMLGNELSRHPGVRADPLSEGLEGIASASRVLVIGTGLTALDMIAGLLDRGHTGTILAVSRRGLRPRPQPPPVFLPPPSEKPPAIEPLDLLEGPLPPYAVAEDARDLRVLLRGLRAHISAVEAQGLSWHAAFDALVLVVARIWPALPLREQLRFLRLLRPWYDVHRFRSPPMTESAVLAAERAGQVTYRAARLRAVTPNADGTLTAVLENRKTGPTSTTVDIIINCSGLDSGKPLSGNPLLASLAERGMVTPHPNGVGFLTDAACRAVTAAGTQRPDLRIIGPPTAGVFGDPLGALFISAQIHRSLPAFVDDLTAS